MGVSKTRKMKLPVAVRLVDFCGSLQGWPHLTQAVRQDAGVCQCKGGYSHEGAEVVVVGGPMVGPVGWSYLCVPAEYVTVEGYGLGDTLAPLKASGLLVSVKRIIVPFGRSRSFGPSFTGPREPSRRSAYISRSVDEVFFLNRSDEPIVCYLRYV